MSDKEHILIEEEEEGGKKSKFLPIHGLVKKFRCGKPSPENVAIIDFCLSAPTFWLGVFAFAPMYEYYFVWSYFAFGCFHFAFTFR